jgi:phage gp36-like protein
MRFCTQADLERALGGAKQLVQLLAKQGANVPDPALVNQVLDAASSEVASYIQVAVDLGSLSEPFPPVLIFKTASCAAFYAWQYGAYGQAIPDPVVQVHEAAIRWARDVADRRATLGTVQKPGLDPLAATVDYDPIATQATSRDDVSKISVASMKFGFR